MHTATHEQITIETPEVENWIGKGDVLVSKMNHRFGELYLIVKHRNDDSDLQFLRCFWVGARPIVSVDMSGDAVTLMSYLVEQYV